MRHVDRPGVERQDAAGDRDEPEAGEDQGGGDEFWADAETPRRARRDADGGLPRVGGHAHSTILGSSFMLSTSASRLKRITAMVTTSSAPCSMG